jgi:hypothetical protein
MPPAAGIAGRLSGRLLDLADQVRASISTQQPSVIVERTARADRAANSRIQAPMRLVNEFVK